MKSILNGMRKFAGHINLVINAVLLTVVYFLGVGLTSVFAKILNKKFLETNKKNTYWSDLKLKEKTMEEYYRQF